MEAPNLRVPDGSVKKKRFWNPKGFDNKGFFE
jgi:hypothetical protein